MEVIEKLAILGEEARHDLCCGACGTHAHREKDSLDRWIYPAALPDGKRVALLKILQTNYCDNECYYCATRRSRDVHRLAFSPDELAHAFDEMVRRRQAEGLFLSSAIAGSANRSMDRMLATAELVRNKYGFKGYIHLKILPGATRAHAEQAIRLATRVSVNLEAPGPKHLKAIAPDKDYSQTLIQIMQWITDIRAASENRLAPGGQTTQFVVGAADEPDFDILQTASSLYKRFGLARAYYSAFQPVPGTPLADHPPTPLLREHRLYQCDFLLRQYEFTFEDLTFDVNGLLPLSTDPKLMWAQVHPQQFPVELNRATKEQLLRVPGIGPKSAARLLNAGRSGKLRSLEDLAKLSIDVKRLAPYVLLDGKRPPYQLPLIASSPEPLAVPVPSPLEGAFA
jgi:putative DNA modification/repair radical SAM protein